MRADIGDQHGVPLIRALVRPGADRPTLPSFRDGALAPDPESRDSGFASRPGMTKEPQSASPYEFFSPLISGPNNSQLSPLNFIICSCSSGAKSVGLVLILV